MHLGEIGRITDDVQNNKTASWFNGERAVVLAIQRQPGSNTVDVSNHVKARFRQAPDGIPPSVKVGVLYDQFGDDQASVHDVTVRSSSALALVVGVIFLLYSTCSHDGRPGVRCRCRSSAFSA